MFWAALLAGIAGYVDAICYLLLGSAFAANMTGNLVEIGIRAARGDWHRAGWILSVVLAFLLGVLAARLILRAQQSPRTALLIEAVVVAATASGVFGLAATPLLAAAMAMQNEAGTHGFVSVNVAFVTGNIQKLGEQLVAVILPSQAPRGGGQGHTILAVLASYAVGAGIGTLASDWGAATLLLAAAALAGITALPPRHTGLADRQGRDAGR